MTDEDFKCLEDGNDNDLDEFINSNNEFNDQEMFLSSKKPTDVLNDNNSVEIADMRSSGQLKIKIKKEDDKFSIVKNKSNVKLSSIHDESNNEQNRLSEISLLRTEISQDAANFNSTINDNGVELSSDSSVVNSQVEEPKQQPISEVTSSITNDNSFKGINLGCITMNNNVQNSFITSQLFKRFKKKDIKILRSRNKKKVENPVSLNIEKEKNICLKDKILEDVGKHEELKFLTKMRMSGLTISPKVLKDHKISNMFPLIKWVFLWHT